MGLALVKYLYYTEGKFVYFVKCSLLNCEHLQRCIASAIKLLSRLLDVVIKSHPIKITHFLQCTFYLRICEDNICEYNWDAQDLICSLYVISRLSETKWIISRARSAHQTDVLRVFQCPFFSRCVKKNILNSLARKSRSNKTQQSISM